MHTHRLINWTLAAGIAAILSTSYMLDGPTDNHAEHAQAKSLTDAQREEKRLYRRDLAAAAVCREQHGEAGYTWSAAGELVCIPRKGKVKHIITAQVQ